MSEPFMPELIAQARRDLSKRGLGGSRPVAAYAWRCEGHWQADDQMDIWQCLDEVELDAMRHLGDPDDEEDDDAQHQT